MSKQSPLVEIAAVNNIVDLPVIRITQKPFYNQYILRGLIEDSAFTSAVKTILDIDLPATANTVAHSEGLTVCWMSPDQWLLITNEPQYSNKFSMLAGALEDVFASINDVSSGQTIINLSGDKANEVLTKGTTLDVHPSIFKIGHCSQVVFAKMNVLIYPVCLDENHDYDLIVRRSFADFLGRWLINACIEYK